MEGALTFSIVTPMAGLEDEKKRGVVRVRLVVVRDKKRSDIWGTLALTPSNPNGGATGFQFEAETSASPLRTKATCIQPERETSVDLRQTI